MDQLTVGVHHLYVFWAPKRGSEPNKAGVVTQWLSGRHMGDIDDIPNERVFSPTDVCFALSHAPAFEIAHSVDGDINLRADAGHKVGGDGHHTSRYVRSQ